MGGGDPAKCLLLSSLCKPLAGRPHPSHEGEVQGRGQLGDGEDGEEGETEKTEKPQQSAMAACHHLSVLSVLSVL